MGSQAADRRVALRTGNGSKRRCLCLVSKDARADGDFRAWLFRARRCAPLESADDRPDGFLALFAAAAVAVACGGPLHLAGAAVPVARLANCRLARHGRSLADV